MAQYVAVAQEKGYDISRLRGSVQNDPIHFRYCGFRPACPLDLSIKLGADVMEFCTKHMSKWYHTTVNMYDLREQGITAPQEVGFYLPQPAAGKVAPQSNDVDVDEKGLIYLVDRHSGFDILEFSDSK